MGSEEEQFFQIVEGILSTDNDIRTKAEATYDGIPADKKIFFLLALTRNQNITDDTQLRQLCGVLLRRLFTTHFDFAWGQLSADAQKQVKDEVIALLGRESETASMRRKICEVAAELARNLMDDEGENKWPEFLQFLFQCASSQSVPLIENSLIVFALVPGIFGNQQNNYLHIIKGMLQQCMSHGEYTVRFYAAKALGYFVSDNEKEEPVMKQFSDLVPQYLIIMKESVAQEEDTLLKLAIDIIGLAPKFVRPSLALFLQVNLEIAQDTNDIDDGYRHLALECCVTAAESIPGGFKKIGAQYIPVLIQLMLQMMTDRGDDEEDEEWKTTDEPVEEDSDSNASIAESALDRFACALGGKTVLNFVMAQIQGMLSHPDWKHRYAGLMAISAVGEGCMKEMEALLPNIVLPILNFLNDPQPQVKYAACNALGQMATDFAPSYEKKFHSKILPGLLGLLSKEECPRVQSHAGAALVNFCEECPRDILKNYAEHMLSVIVQCFNAKLEELQRNQKKLVLEQLITTIAAIANTLEEDFIPFYDGCMPVMKFILQNANGEDVRLLRGKTIECASLIGLAVGPDKFTQDASDIMEFILRTQVENGGIQIADDDPQLSYMITAWARICQILGERFAPYLPMVMPPVLKTAAIKPELAMLDPEEVKDVEGNDDWELIPLGDSQSAGLHTARLEDKSMACKMLICYARYMKGHFRPYVDEVIKIMLPLLKFYFHDGVRAAAAEILPHLIRCLEGDPQAQVMLWNLIQNDLLIAAETEPEAECKYEQLFAIASSIEILPREAFNVDLITKVTNVVEKVFQDHFERSLERAEQRKDEDYDEIIEQQLWDEMEEDNAVLTKAADIIHAFLKTQGPGYLAFMEPNVIPAVIKLVGQDRFWQERHWGMCIWDDIVEYTGPAAAKYMNNFVPMMLNDLGDSHAEIRQACSYGCGVMAQFGLDPFTQWIDKALPGLVRIIQDPEARNEDNIAATENAISAVAKIIKHRPTCINIDQVVPTWISWLPIWEDKEEMNHVYGLLCDLLESNSPAALGPQGSNLPRIVQIAADAFVQQCLADDSPVKPRLINLIRMIQSDANMFQQCVVALNPEQQKALQDALQQPSA